MISTQQWEISFTLDRRDAWYENIADIKKNDEI